MRGHWSEDGCAWDAGGGSELVPTSSRLSLGSCGNGSCVLAKLRAKCPCQAHLWGRATAAASDLNRTGASSERRESHGHGRACAFRQPAGRRVRPQGAGLGTDRLRPSTHSTAPSTSPPPATGLLAPAHTRVARSEQAGHTLGTLTQTTSCIPSYRRLDTTRRPGLGPESRNEACGACVGEWVFQVLLHTEHEKRDCAPGDCVCSDNDRSTAPPYARGTVKTQKGLGLLG